MRANAVKQKWARGEAVVNGWLQIPSSYSAELMAHGGFDSLVVDLQHGVIEYQVAVTMLQAISTTPVVPMVRIAGNDASQIGKILDAGAYGVICPMVNSAAEAEALVRACRYAPRGVRSWGPARAALYGGADYGDHADDEILVMPMIETAEAVSHVDEIVEIPGFDAVYVGPSDLALTLGCEPRSDPTDPRVLEALQTIVEACRNHGKIAGIHNATPEFALQMIAAGFRFVTLASDRRYLAAQAAAMTATVREGIAAMNGAAAPAGKARPSGES